MLSRDVPHRWIHGKIFEKILLGGDIILIDYFTRMEAMEVMNEEKGKNLPLYSAIASGNLAMASMLISNGADVNEKGLNGFSAISIAIRTGNFEAVKMLIDNKVDVNQLDIDECSHINRSISRGNYPVSELMIKNGANVNGGDISKIRPITLAIDGGQLEILELLIKHGADVTGEDRNGKQIFREFLKRCCHDRKCFDIVKLMIYYGADISEDGNRSLCRFFGFAWANELFGALDSPWTKKTHHHFQKAKKITIKTIFLLLKRNSILKKLPMDIILVLCQFCMI
jgi:hypothetical protein